jgi:ABC-type uncharacterized transport system involved in gliding motility auxiliary subunit
VTKKQQIIVTVLSIVIMLLLILISRRVWTRADLSSGKSNTLAPVSRNLYMEIGETVRITYYCTGRLAAMYPVPGEISDLLREYAARSRGKIQVSIRDPSRGFAQEVERFGLLAQTLPNVGEDELSLVTVYSGIVIEYLNQAEVIPLVFSVDTLEYDITSRIRAMTRGRKREIGIICPDPGKNLSDYYEILNQAFSQAGISVLPLGAGDEIPDTLPALFVLGGVETMDNYSLYRVDRYIRLGGRVLFAVESVNVDFAYTWDARLMEDGGLLTMLSGYGAVVEPALVMDKASHILPYRDSSGKIMQIRYPPWISVMGENGSRDSALTSGFPGVDLFWASPLSLRPPENVRGVSLFSSTSEAWLMTKDFFVKPEMNYLFAAEEEATKGSKILAVSLEGVFPGWFEGREKPEDGGSLPDMPREAKESRLIVVGDSDLGGIFMQPVQSQINLDFLLQAADWLGSDEDVAAIRSRRTGTGRLDRITDPAKRIWAMAFARILNVVLIPVAIMAFGAIRILKRRPAGGKNRSPVKEKGAVE